jgi:hypothetical protein
LQKQNDWFEQLTAAFSQERLAAYLAKGLDKREALAAYCWNTQLSQAFYPALQTLEIALRNSIHQAISDIYQTNWFDTLPLHALEQTAITKAKTTLAKQRKQPEPSRIVAELHFGFWTSLLDVRYEHNQILWPRLLKASFPAMPRKIRTRHYLSKQLNRIRNLRNRVFHYEPIWHWHDLAEQHAILLALIQWLSPAARQYIILLDEFPRIQQQGLGYYRDLLAKTLK